MRPPVARPAQRLPRVKIDSQASQHSTLDAIEPPAPAYRAQTGQPSAFAGQELAHSPGVTHEEPLNVRRLFASFGTNLTQEWRGVLVCSGREVKRKHAFVKTAAVHSDVIVFATETAEYGFKQMLYF